MFSTICRDARIVYRLAGSQGSGVVLLHCTGGSVRQWSDLVEQLSPQHTTLAVDLYGHGESDPWPGERPLSLEDEAAAVLSAAEVLPAPVHLVGHSYGGAVALKLATLYPQRVKSLTLIEPVAFHLLRGRSAEDQRLFLEIGRIALTVSRATGTGHYQQGLKTFVDYWNGAGAWDALPKARRAQLLRQVGVVALNFWATLTEPLRAEALAAVACPTLVLSGEASPPVTRRIAELVAHAIPGARFDRVEGAGHMLPLTHPVTVNTAIAQLIDRCDRGPADPCRSAA